MDTSRTDQDTFLAIARVLRDSPGFDAWNGRFHDPVQREAYRLAVTQLGDETCHAHGLPTWAAIDEAEQQSAKAGHAARELSADTLPEPWTKTTGEPL